MKNKTAAVTGYKILLLCEQRQKDCETNATIMTYVLQTWNVLVCLCEQRAQYFVRQHCVGLKLSLEQLFPCLVTPRCINVSAQLK